MKIPYYPGCTLKTSAKNFEDSAIAVLNALEVELVELPRWNCCGTVYSLASDDLMHKLAPVRNLIRVKEQNENRVVTLCAMCYNTLKRTNIFVKQDKEARNKMNEFMDTEQIKYEGDVEVLHILQLLRDEITFKKIEKKVKQKIELKAAAYYGCLLLRPEEISIDNPENPSIMEELFASIGIEMIDFPYKNECCGAYQTVNEPELIAERTYKMLNCARKMGASVVLTSCPLCQFNLDNRQKIVSKKYADFETIPVLYFTQLLGATLGLDKKYLRFDLNYVNPLPLLYK